MARGLLRCGHAVLRAQCGERCSADKALLTCALAYQRVYDHPRCSSLPRPRRSPHMQSNDTSKLAEIVQSETRELLADWVKQQCAADTLRPDLMNERELREQSQQFLSAFSEAMQHGALSDISGAAWATV